MIRGIGAAEGIAIGKAFIKSEVEMKVAYRKIDHPEYELDRFNAAAEKCRIELERRYNKTVNILGKEEAEIYRRHLNVFDGSILMGQVRKEIQEQKINAEFILHEVMKKYASMFDKVADEFLKKKSQSIKYIAEQIIRELLGVDATGLSEIDEPSILFARELDSADIVHLDRELILGIVTEVGGKNSYSAIISNNFNIPSVVGVKKALTQVQAGDTVIIDGQKGEVYLNPEDSLVDFYKKKLNKDKELEDVYQTFKDKKTVTMDGYEFELGAICEHMNTIAPAEEQGAQSIGLFKTEFVFLGRDVMPSEEAQLDAYRETIAMAEGSKVTFKVLDCSADNNLPYVYFHEERNPAMGYRSIRMLLSERELFITQLKALLQASAYGSMRIAFPMVTSIDELLDVKVALEEAKVSLEERGIIYDNELEIGVIIETPVAAAIADLFAREVDFIIIGSDNLIQYMTAVERTSEHLFELYDIYHPGIIRTIRNIVIASHREGTWVGVIGDVANNEYYIPLLAAIGVDQIALPPTQISKARWIVSRTDKGLWEKEVETLLELNSGNEIKMYLEKRNYEEIIWKNE